MGAIIRKAAEVVGVDVGILMALAGMESSFRPSAGVGTSSAKGLFQFLEGTWADMVRSPAGKRFGIGLGDIMDPWANAVMGAVFIKNNIARLRQIGRPPSATDVYLMHLLGPNAGGGPRFFAALKVNPNQVGAALFPKQARSNPDVFFAGGKALTLAAIYTNLSARIDKINQAVAQSSSAVQDEYARASTAATKLFLCRSLTANLPACRKISSAVSSPRTATRSGARLAWPTAGSPLTSTITWPRPSR